MTAKRLGSISLVLGLPEPQKALLREGACPDCRVSLAVHSDIHGGRWGWCAGCRRAWSIRPDGQVWADPRVDVPWPTYM